jgi:hypothetical protein
VNSTPDDFIEYSDIFSDVPNSSAHVLISARGVVSVEIDNSTPFFFSAKPDDVRRAIEFCSADIDVINRHPPQHPYQGKDRLLIRCSMDGHQSRLDISHIEIYQDFALAGLMTELGMVSNADLALSLKSYRNAKSATGNTQHTDLDIAANTFAVWAKRYCDRNQIIWDSNLGPEVRYTDPNGNLHVYGGVDPKSIPSLPGIKVEDQGRLFEEYLKFYLKDFVITETSDGTIVSAAARNLIEMPPPSPELVEYIKHLQSMQVNPPQ